MTTLAGIGVIAGLVLLARGLSGYRSLVRVGDTSTSTIASLAAGEVRVSGIVEPAELTLVSLLQSVPCVYYHATVGSDQRSPWPMGDGYEEEQSIGFRIRDATGSLRVFPRGARFDAPVRFEGETDLSGDEPAGLAIRQGGSTGPAEIDEAVAVARAADRDRSGESPATRRASAACGGRRSYREARLEPGDAVTIVGRALPFSDLADPAWADVGGGSDPLIDDPEIAADLAEARAAGHPRRRSRPTAWGNAAIPGFGIGRPVVAPVIDPAANALPLADAEAAARAERTFRIAPETLVLAASDEVPLLIAHGIPGVVVGRGQGRFLVGLLGAVLAIASAMVVALSLGGGLGIVSAPEGCGRRSRSCCSSAIGAFHRANELQRCRGTPAADRQGVVEHRRRPQAAPRSAAEPRRRGPRPDGLRTGRPDRGDRGARGLLPDRADPRPGRRSPKRPPRPSARCSRSSSATRTSSRPRTSLDLQDEIERLEAMIADRRELYNDQVYRYNTRIAQVPALVLAPLFGWRPREFFAADAAELERPDVVLPAG